MENLRRCQISSVYNARNAQDRQPAADPNTPYGTIDLKCKTSVPGTFVMLHDDGGDTLQYTPSLHGCSAAEITRPSKIGLIKYSTLATTAVTVSPSDNEVLIMNTGSNSLRRQDRFFIGQPIESDIISQKECIRNYDDDDTKCYFGALLATKRIESNNYSSELIEKYRSGETVNMADIISPMAQQATLGLFKLITAINTGRNVNDNYVRTSINVATGAAVATSNEICNMLADGAVANYINDVLAGASEVFSGMWGYGVGQVTRIAESGKDEAETGELFYAKMSRM